MLAEVQKKLAAAAVLHLVELLRRSIHRSLFWSARSAVKFLCLRALQGLVVACLPRTILEQLTLSHPVPYRMFYKLQSQSPEI